MPSFLWYAQKSQQIFWKTTFFVLWIKQKKNPKKYEFLCNGEEKRLEASLKYAFI